MDIEQLKLVIETVKSVSGDAQAVAIWWLVLDKLLPIIAWLIVAALAYKIISVLVHKVLLEKECEETLKILRDTLGCGYGYLSQEERNRIVKKVIELNAKDKS